MSKINDLIKVLCPNGVEYKPIKETFYLFSGMTGVSNKWADEGNCQFIDYMNAYKNNKINVKNTPYATVKNLRQNELKKGDLLLTSASEVPDECAVSAVIEDDIKNGVFMDDHLFGLRLKEEYSDRINTTFINYYLNSKPFRNTLFKAVRGVTRFYISNDNYVKLLIPIPPLEVQDEIVRILDKFDELEAELEAELEVRREQYDFWRGKLFDISDAKEYKFDDISKIITKQTGFDYTNHIKSSLVVEKTDESIPYIQTKFFAGKNFNYNTDYYIPKKDAYKFNKILLNNKCILLSIVGASIGNIGLFDGETESFLGGAIGLVKLKDDINIDYVYHYLQSPYGQAQIKNNIKGSGQASLTIDSIRNFMIPIPSNDKQNKVVSILDKMETLVNDIAVGIPAEIELRRKQYEYYRNKLLSFEELSVSE